MLKLIVWLNLNETFGLRDKLAVACIGLFMIAAISSQFSGYFGMRTDSRMTGWFIPEADRPLTHLSDRGRVESLLRGTQVNAKQETLFESQRCWRRQFISRRAPSRSPAGQPWPMSSSTVRWTRVIRLPYAAWCFRENTAVTNANSHLPATVCPIRHKTAGSGNGPCGWRGTS